MTYPVVDDEERRLDALRGLEIVDTPRTAAFDAIAELAADVLDCPIAFISLLEKDRQWFKAECGLGVSETPRNIAFCNYTVLGTDVFIVEDALREPRFASNPLVTGEPGIRFYAGVPISLQSGHRIGALCVCDRRPRAFHNKDIERLRHFGELAEASVAAHAQAVWAGAMARDAGEKAQLLWKKNRLLGQVERIGKIGGWELDLVTNTCNWSDEVSRIHELPLGGSYRLEEALSFYPDEWRKVVEHNIEETLRTGEPYNFEAQFVTARGNRKWVRAAGECEQKDGRPARLFGMFQDITLEKEASERLWKAAHFDDLTGLANRRRFNERLANAIEEAGTEGRALALMLVDLDNFKEVNDTRGHDVGDEILKEIGCRLEHEAMEGCFVSRLGGDEFAVIAAGDQSADHLRKRGEQFLARLKQPIRVGPMHIHIGGTIGIARYPADAATAPDLLRMADLALYDGKQTHRGSINFYTPRLATLFERHLEAADLLRSALGDGRLVPFYQPKVRLDDGRCCGFEALARIVTEDGSVVGPSTFGLALEDRTLARRVGKQMLTAVTADMACWQEAGLDPISVSLNAAEADFADGKLVNRVVRRLDELGLQRRQLTVEVTESVFLGDEAWQAREILERLNQEGIKIELDDFGTGYASLTHLRAFPVSRLKIDRSFIEDLGQHAGSSVIVHAVIDLGHNLGCDIVAEGVETELQAKLLRDMGCDLAQGYLFGHPLNAEETRQGLVTRMQEQQGRLRDIAKRHGQRSPRLRAS